MEQEIKMTSNVESAAADIGADLASLRTDVAHLAERIGELAQHGKQAARSHLSDAVGVAQGKIGDTAAHAQSQIRAAGGDFEASIERNPLTAVAIAFAVGLGVGVLNRSWR
jgi:ElaB/YqjD/DUF883 family membrane-anchored ribosome-binding protein